MPAQLVKSKRKSTTLLASSYSESYSYLRTDR